MSDIDMKDNVCNYSSIPQLYSKVADEQMRAMVRDFILVHKL